MGSLYKRDGIWYAKFTDKGKIRRISLKTKSVQRARVKLVKIEEALDEGRPVGHFLDCEVDRFTETYLKHISTELRPHTIKTRKHLWQKFRDEIKPIMLSDITREKATEYKSFLFSEGYSKNTIRSTLATLGSIFSAAINDLHCFGGPNPFKGVPLPKIEKKILKDHKGFPRFLELQEIDALLEKAREHSRDMLLLTSLGVYAGLRKNELINAKWDWIDFERGHVILQSSPNFDIKNSQERVIPLSTRLRTILEPFKKAPDEYIAYPSYPPKVGNATAYRVDFEEAFKTTCRRAGLPWCSPHKLRHTFASQHAMAGTSIFKISQWLGHQKLETTMIYAALSPNDGDIDNF